MRAVRTFSESLYQASLFELVGLLYEYTGIEFKYSGANRLMPRHCRISFKNRTEQAIIIRLAMRFGVYPVFEKGHPDKVRIEFARTDQMALLEKPERSLGQLLYDLGGTMTPKRLTKILEEETLPIKEIATGVRASLRAVTPMRTTLGKAHILRAQHQTGNIVDDLSAYYGFPVFPNTLSGSAWKWQWHMQSLPATWDQLLQFDMEQSDHRGVFALFCERDKARLVVIAKEGDDLLLPAYLGKIREIRGTHDAIQALMDAYEVYLRF